MGELTWADYPETDDDLFELESGPEYFTMDL